MAFHGNEVCAPRYRCRWCGEAHKLRDYVEFDLLRVRMRICPPPEEELREDPGLVRLLAWAKSWTPSEEDDKLNWDDAQVDSDEEDVSQDEDESDDENYGDEGYESEENDFEQKDDEEASQEGDLQVKVAKEVPSPKDADADKLINKSVVEEVCHDPVPIVTMKDVMHEDSGDDALVEAPPSDVILVPEGLMSIRLESRRKRPFGPRLNFSAEAAVQCQLDALKYNDQPRPDYGIEVMYRFAGFDPFERSTYFGPFFDLGQFERFRRIFHHSTYRVLLCHKDRKILSTLWIEENRFKQRVWIQGARPEEEEIFQFTMAQRVGGSWDGYWLTESLLHDGDGFSGGIAY